MTDLQRVIEGLSEAMRSDIRKSEPTHFWSADNRTWKAVERRGLIEGGMFRSSPYTPLGLAVRAALLPSPPTEETNDADT